MTITEALTQLTQAWPKDSFCIGVEVWSHVHKSYGILSDTKVIGRQTPATEWSIYSSEQNHAYRHPTLAGALALALNRSSLAEVESAVEGI